MRTPEPRSKRSTPLASDQSVAGSAVDDLLHNDSTPVGLEDSDAPLDDGTRVLPEHTTIPTIPGEETLAVKATESTELTQSIPAITTLTTANAPSVSVLDELKEVDHTAPESTELAGAGENQGKAGLRQTTLLPEMPS
jgi:hypothetical protein